MQFTGPVHGCACVTDTLRFTVPSSAVLGHLSSLAVTTEHFILTSLISGKSIWTWGCCEDCPLGICHLQTHHREFW